jgi:hypothetical protein
MEHCPLSILIHQSVIKTTRGGNLMNHKAFFVAVMLLTLVALLPSASGVVAQGSAATGGTISYSGRLSNDAGQPVADGVYALTFALYDAAQDGNLLWSETQTGVTVKGGAFTALLGSMKPLPKEARISKGWLVVSVRGPGETVFTALSPRQALNAATTASPSSPAAGSTCAHTHFGEAWTGDSMGTTAGAGLKVQDTKVNGYGIWGEADNGSGSVGVHGHSTSGDGVWGNSDSSFGVYGQSTSGVGVYGYSSGGFAMDADGNAKQPRYYGGWVKAMALVAGTSITRCYNSQTTGASVSTAPCGFSSTGSSGTFTVDFGFQVNDRFVSVTPNWGGSGVPSAVVDSFPTANSVKVRISSDSAFFIIIY